MCFNISLFEYIKKSSDPDYSCATLTSSSSLAVMKRLHCTTVYSVYKRECICKSKNNCLKLLFKHIKVNDRI